MTEASIEPFAPAPLDGLIALVAAEGWSEYADDAERTRRALIAPGMTTLVAIAVQLDIRTRTEGYYERLGASRSLGYRLTREDLGLG